MNTKIWKLVLVLSLFSLTACAGGATFEGTSWQLVSMSGKSPVINTQPTINFEDGQVYGNSSCNSYGGEYKPGGESIEFGMMMSTAMACADHGAMDQEQEYLAFLGSVGRWEMKDGQLFLFRADGDALVFEVQN